MGAEKLFGDTWLLGGGVGFGHEQQKIGSQGTRSDGNSYSLAVYGSYQPLDGLFLDGLLGHGTLDFDSRRHVTDIGSTAEASRKGSQWFESLTAAYEHKQGQHLWAHYVRMDLSQTRLRQSAERGAGAYNLTYFEQDVLSTKLALGLRGETEVSLGNGTASPYFRLEYQREFDDGGIARMAYSDSLFGPIYSLEGLAVDRDTLIVDVGSQFRLQRGWRLGLGYRFSYGSASTQTHGFLANVKRSF